jgi:photosystem II stability/assembly factor-like uncharacterized protein
MIDFIPTTRGLSRVFIQEGRARADHEAVYQGCMMAGGIEQSLGDVTQIKCPSPKQRGRYDVVGYEQGELGQPTTSLTELYPVDLVSTLERLKRLRCPYDVHIVLGTCEDPENANDFTKRIIFERGVSTSYSTDEIGSLTDGDDTRVHDSTDLSGEEFYSVVPLVLASRGGDVVTNPLNDVVYCGGPSCGDCEDEGDGCTDVYAVGASAPGSPGTAPDVIYSADGGVTLAADEITTLNNGDEAEAIACVNIYVVVSSNGDGAIHYKTKTVLDAGTAAGWTRNATNIAVGGEPNDMWSLGYFAFVVGDGGYVYSLTNPVAGVTVLDAGGATTENLNAVHALNRNFAVAVGANGAVIYTENQVTWTQVTVGAVYYTLDGGTTWTLFTNFPVTLANVEDIAFGTDAVGYIAGNIAGPTGVVLRTYDGGNTWVSLPEDEGTLTAADEYRAIAACEFDPNAAVFVGLADDASDGVYVTGDDGA